MAEADQTAKQHLLDMGLAQRLRGLRGHVQEQYGKRPRVITTVGVGLAEKARGVGDDEESALIELLHCECGHQAKTCDASGLPLCEDCAYYMAQDAEVSDG